MSEENPTVDLYQTLMASAKSKQKMVGDAEMAMCLDYVRQKNDYVMVALLMSCAPAFRANLPIALFTQFDSIMAQASEIWSESKRVNRENQKLANLLHGNT